MISWDEQRIELAVPWPTLAVAASAPPTAGRGAETLKAGSRGKNRQRENE